MTVALEERRELRELLEEKARRTARRKFFTYYPDTGPLRRALYPKNLEFFEAGARFRQRGILAANRYGKSEGVGGYEVTCHATGLYPEWWKGRRFEHPISAWAAGDTLTTVRDIIQFKLLGPLSELGTGLIPGDAILKVSMRQGVADTVDTIHVKNAFGGVSIIGLKSYDQGRISFQGTEKHVIWLDEEWPLDVYTECLLRTMTTNGILISTFTPVKGLSEAVMYFLGEDGDVYAHGEIDGKYLVRAEWGDAPHLTKEQKEELLRSIPAFQRDARSRGIPQLGAGAIYPVPESDFVVDPFPLPAYFPRGYGMDVGWERTAVGFFAKDPTSGTLYLTDEYYRSHAEPIVHAATIKARGHWLRGVIDPASRASSQKDGESLLNEYIKLGLHLEQADNNVESGILLVWGLLSTGRLKVFKNCTNWLAEARMYRRDEKGRVVKKMDHLMDATRYFVSSGIDRMCVEPSPFRERGGSPLAVFR